MRVLAIGNVYPPHLLGGYEVIWHGVTRELVRQGHAARVLATDYRNPDVDAGAPEEADVHRQLRWYWHDHEWLQLGVRERFELERHNAAVFDRHVAEFKPDVIAWWAVGGMSLSLIARSRRAGIPGVFFVLDYWPDYGQIHDLWTAMWRPRGRRPVAALAQALTGIPTRLDLAAGGRWVFCSSSMQEGLSAMNLASDQQTILTPGVEQFYLDHPSRPELPEWSWRLLYLGRIVEQKGVLTAVRALAKLPDQTTLRLVGPGDGTYRSELEREAVALGVSERVSFEAPVDRSGTVDAYRNADCLLFPVNWPEPWGLVPLEAMALGVPVIATGRGGSGDFLADDVNSLLFEAGDADALAERVRRLADDPALRRRLVDGGRATAARHTEDTFNRSAVTKLEDAAGG